MDALQLFDHWVAHEAAKPRDCGTSLYFRERVTYL